MSKKRLQKDYEKTITYRFKQWFYGTKDPFLDTVEMRVQKEPIEEEEAKRLRLLERRHRMERLYDVPNNAGIQKFDKFYHFCSAVFCIFLVWALLYGVAGLPSFGETIRSVNNEVSARYIESGLQETGSVNIVTGMILTYRAFDTFGETNVLFIATICVMAMLAVDDKALKKQEFRNDRMYEPKNDVILQKVATLLVPCIFVFGIYIIVNGQLSPGGGFSGGATLGAGMILYVSAFGFKKTGAFFNEKVYKVAKVTALCMYGLIGTYYYTCGANGIADHIPLGIAGHILSGGIIFPIDVCVGIEVACTMYAFYALFRRGGL